MKTRLHSIPRVCGIALAVALLTTPSAVNADVALQSDEFSPWTQDESEAWVSPAVERDDESSAWFEATSPCFVSFKWRTDASQYGAYLYVYRNYNGSDIHLTSLYSPQGDWASSSFKLSGEYDNTITFRFSNRYYSGDNCICYLKDVEVQPIYTEIIGEIEWSYIVDGGNATIVDAVNTNMYYQWGYSYNSPIEGDVTIPSTIGENIPVTAIGDNVFNNAESVTSVTIPDGVTSIGIESIYDCNSLTNITIGTGLASYGGSSLEDNRALASFAVAEGNATYSSEDGVLYNKAKTVLVKCPAMKTSLAVPATVTEIADFACYGCALEEVSFSEGLVAIGADAFGSCTELEAIDLPESLKTIGAFAFSACRLLEDAELGGVLDIGECAFESCTSLEKIVIPNCTTNIGGSAFSYCGELSDVTIGSNVAEIGVIPTGRDEEYGMVDVAPAFGGCDSLMNFKLAEGNEKYEEIGGCLFYRATPRYEKTLAVYPAGRDDLWFTGDVNVTKIGDGACAQCQKFTTLVITNSVREIGVCSFVNDGDLSKVVVLDGVTNICYGAFQLNMELMDVEIAGSVKTIGEDVFIHDYMPGDIWDNPRLGRLVLHEGIETISGGAFNFCQWLGEITIPDSVTTLGEGAFSENSYGAPAITIGDGITSVTANAFSGCPNCKRITFGENVTTIEDGAFSGCEKVTELEIPEGVASIGESAFSGCYELRTLSLPDSLVSIGANAFSGCRWLKKLVVPANVTEIGDGAFVEADCLWKIYLPASLKPEETEGGETVEFLSRVFPDMGFDSLSEEGIDDIVFWYSEENPLPYATVTFNDGEEQAEEQVLAFFDELPMLSKSGYAFAGWWTTPDDEEEVGSQLYAEEEVEDGTTYYARWEETPFTFGGDAPWFATGEIDDYDAPILQSAPLGYGEVAIARTSVAGTGYIAINFTNNSNNDDYLRVYVDGVLHAAFAPSWDDWRFTNIPVIEGGNHVVEVRYENYSGSPDTHAQFGFFEWRPENVCTVTFNANGGATDAQPRKVIESTSVGELPVAKKSGKVFAGWYTDATAGERVTSDTSISEDCTLYAQYTDAPYATGGEAGWLIDEDGSLRTEGIAIGQSATMETTFSGHKRVSFNWKMDLYDSDDFIFYVDGEAEINRSGQVSKWMEYTRDFEDDGETHTIKWEFVRSEYSYDYDYYDNCGWLANIVIADIYTVTFNDNYAGGGTDECVVAGTLGELPGAPYRDDYFMFDGWFTASEGGTLVTSETPVTSDATYYAHWTPTPYKFRGEWVADEDDDGSYWRSMVTESYTTYSASKEVEGPCVVSFKWKAETVSGYQTVYIIDRSGGGYDYLEDTAYPSAGWNEQTLTISDGSVHALEIQLYTGSFSSSSYYIAIKDFNVTPLPSYTLTFYPNYGEEAAIARKVPQENAVVGEPPALWRDGYVVNGWWTDATGGDRIAADTAVSSDSTYYAHWAETDFAFSGTAPWSMEEDGSFRSGVVNTYNDESVATLTVQGPVRVIYEAKISAGYSTYLRCYADRQMVKALSGMSDWTTITNEFVDLETHTIKLDFSKNNSSDSGGENCAWVRNVDVAAIAAHAVTFQPNYDGGGDPVSRIVEHDKEVGTLPGCFREGYVVEGWYTAATGGERIDADTVISADATYYAHWQETGFAFSGDAPWTLEADGSMRAGLLTQYDQQSIATVTVTGPCAVTFDWKLYAPNYDARLYLYVDDNYDSNCNYGSWSSVTRQFADEGTHTLSFKYRKESSSVPGVGESAWVRNFTVTPVTPCVVTFDRNYDGAPAASTRNVIDGERVGELPDPLRYGYAFTGWYTQAEGGSKVSAYTYITEDVTYYAHWTDSKDKFDSTGGNARWTVDSEGTWRSGLVSGSGASSWASATFEGPCVVSFRWKTTTYYGTLSVALDDCDALDSISSDMTSWAAKEVKIVDGGEHVLKWTYTMNYSYASDSSFGYVRDVVVTPLDVSTVTFNPNYSGGETTTRNVETGDQLGALPTVSRDGYRLVGWFTEATGGNQILATTAVNGNMTVYAHWVERGLELTYELHDSYGDGWNGCAIKVFDASDDTLIANLTIDNGREASGVISVTAGMTLRIVWVAGSYENETSYTIYGVDDSVILEGSRGFSDPVEYTVPGPAAPETPAVVVDNTKMEDPVVDETTGVRTIEAKDGVTLDESDVASVTISSPTDPTVDITEAYTKTLDPVNNQIVITLAAPAVEEVADEENKDTEDATGLLEDVSKVDDEKIAEMPTPDTTKNEEVGALPVKMYPGLYYQASWGNDLNNLTPGEKFRADGSQTHIGVIKQKSDFGFYKLSVFEK